jgi:biopolymer transport protein ExbD
MWQSGRRHRVNFKPRRPAPEPEINLIPFIDVLLVVMIFLLLTTSGARLTEIQLQLPEADTDTASRQPRVQQITLTITAQGQFTVNKTPVGTPSVAGLVAVLTPLAHKETLLVISADAAAQHQSVIHAMEAARRSGLSQITFAAQSAQSAEATHSTGP